MEETEINIGAIVNKFKRRKFLGTVYFPTVILITTCFMILAIVVPTLSKLFFSIALYSFVLFWLIGSVFLPSYEFEEKIAYHLKKASDNIENTKEAKKEIASAIKGLEELLSYLETFLFIEPTLKPLSELAENLRQRIYPALDNTVAKNLVPSTLAHFLSGNIELIKSINAEIESTLAKLDERQNLYYEMPKLYSRIYEASKEVTVKFWRKSPYNRFFITLLILLSGYLIIASLALLKIENAIIAAIIIASTGLSVARAK